MTGLILFFLGWTVILANAALLIARGGASPVTDIVGLCGVSLVVLGTWALLRSERREAEAIQRHLTELHQAPARRHEEAR